MQEATALTSWANFYVIIGSAAAALTGLMFVVITLIAGTREPRSGGSVAAFGTPTVVHFCAALLVAVILSAPWQTVSNGVLLLLLGLAGLGGMIYVLIIVRRARLQSDYQPILEDWLWHTVFPLVSYAALVVAVIMLPGSPVQALFVIAAVTVLLLFIGIHNAWDSVTYIVVERYQSESEKRTLTD